MTKLRTILVDDEPLALSLLRSKLKIFSEIDVIAECKNGREAIKAILDLAPDLIFLDIRMPGIDGFNVIKNIQTDMVPLVIFATAYEQYALHAFDVHAVDYILKPIEEEQVHRAIHRAIERFNKKEDIHNKSNIISAIETINKIEVNAEQAEQPFVPIVHNSPQLEQKIAIKGRDEITLLKQSEIEWVDAAGDYSCLHVRGVTHIKRCTLKSLLQDLDPSIFKQIHRSTIVNLNFIQKVIPHTKGEYFLQLGEYDKIKVSRNYREVIKSYLTKS